MHRPSARLALILSLFVFISACATERAAVRAPQQQAAPAAEAEPPAQEHPPTPSEAAFEEEVTLLHRVSRLYGYQAKILQAQADGDYARAEALFDEAMQALAILLEQPGATEHSRVRALYRSLVREYEHLHGAPLDSLMLPQGKVFAFREAAFAALEEVRDPLLEDVHFPDLRPIRTEVPLTRNRLVRQSIDFLLRTPENHLYHWLSRADTYFPMIEQILREVGAPGELKYLAMIESGLNPQAVSWAGAVGMWQFMPATGRAYDLQITGWVDERRDPEKATRAAARHLVDLYERFGDWQLAIAGYNCGAGNVSRALRRARQSGREATFWGAYPYLPRETRNYVPMYIAAALVASNPTAFDVDLSEVPDGPRYAYDYVPIEGSLSLRTVAELAGTTTTTIRALNPELRRGYTPPTDGAYFVRIPRGTYQRFAAAYADLPESMKQPVSEHLVRSGDTLGEIAGRYGVSVRELMQRNGLRSTVIHPGQHLVVPVPHYESDLSLAEAEPVRVVYGQRIIQPLAAFTPGLSVNEVKKKLGEPDDSETQGATASTRSETEGVSVDEALRKLGMQDDEEPQEEKKEGEDAQWEEEAVPVRKASLSASDENKEPTTHNPQPATEKTEEPEQPEKERTTYEVRSGDTLGEIADRHDVYTSDLRRWNDLSGSRIYPGQELVMYGAAEPPAPTRLTYRVRSGDTLSEIADSYGVSAREVRAWNDLSGSRIRIGQHLTIYPDGSQILYRVQSGDNLIEIAREHGVSVGELKRWNDLSNSRIYPGQELKIRT